MASKKTRTNLRRSWHNTSHETLERGQPIAQPERHHQELKMIVVGVECRLFDVIGVHANFVVVELGEELGAMELVEFIDHRDRVLVFHCLLVESAVVHAEAPGVVGLLHQQYRRGERRHARPDDALGEHGGALALELVARV